MEIHYRQWANPTASGLGACPERTLGRTLAEAISLTAEVCGQALSPTAAEILASDLRDFNEAVVLAALARCRMELPGPLTLPGILARIEDGRPDVDEAWAMMPESELASVVWTDEMAQAWGVASPLLNAGDVSGARTAFCEVYAKAVLAARIRREPPHWLPSLGSDASGRERALLDAVRKRRLSPAHAAQLLPFGAASSGAEEIIAQIKVKNMN